MKMEKYNYFHLVEKSPWPVSASIGALLMVTSGLAWATKTNKTMIMLSLATILIISYSWWRDVHRESMSQGNHTNQVMNGLKAGMVLFIASEVLFFTSFFWAFFHSSISPTMEIGQEWPPSQVTSFNPMSIPLLNTLLLLSSGVTVTWAHHAMLMGKMKKANLSLATTVLLGGIFTGFQGFEYMEAPFSMSDSVFGSTFFMATGFHGIHVIIGSTFLTVSLIRMTNMANSNSHLVGFECAAWYWHFVDVVWLFLYSMLYWWGG